MKFSLITIYGSNVKAYMDLMRADHLFIHNYIRSLLNIILRPIIMVRMWLEPGSYILQSLYLSGSMNAGLRYHLYTYILIILYTLYFIKYS